MYDGFVCVVPVIEPRTLHMLGQRTNYFYMLRKSVKTDTGLCSPWGGSLLYSTLIYRFFCSPQA